MLERNSYFINYLLIVSYSGFIILFIFSLFAFTNQEFYDIKKNKYKKAGAMLLISSFVYSFLFNI
jgi:hypothetical protein